jgi:hypothetical protein
LINRLLKWVGIRIICLARTCDFFCLRLVTHIFCGNERKTTVHVKQLNIKKVFAYNRDSNSLKGKNLISLFNRIFNFLMKPYVCLQSKWVYCVVWVRILLFIYAVSDKYLQILKLLSWTRYKIWMNLMIRLWLNDKRI